MENKQLLMAKTPVGNVVCAIFILKRRYFDEQTNVLESTVFGVKISLCILFISMRVVSPA